MVQKIFFNYVKNTSFIPPHDSKKYLIKKLSFYCIILKYLFFKGIRCKIIYTFFKLKHIWQKSPFFGLSKLVNKNYFR